MLSNKSNLIIYIWVLKEIFTTGRFKQLFSSLAPGALVQVCGGHRRKQPLDGALDFQSQNLRATFNSQSCAISNSILFYNIKCCMLK